jgi:hypothetical protein
VRQCHHIRSLPAAGWSIAECAQTARTNPDDFAQLYLPLPLSERPSPLGLRVVEGQPPPLPCPLPILRSPSN